MAAAFIMFSGVGIIGALSSILASMLVGGGEPEPEETPGVTPPLTAEQELAAIKEELAQLRQMLQNKDDEKMTQNKVPVPTTLIILLPVLGVKLSAMDLEGSFKL